MDFKPVLIVALSVALVGVTLAQTKPAGVGSGAAEIKAVGDAFAAAWNKHDPKAMAAVWAADGDLIDPFGASAKGRADVEKFFTSDHTGKGQMVGTHYTITTQTSRMVRPDVAVAEWDVDLTGMKDAEGTDRGNLKHHITVLLSKEGGQWLVQAGRPVIYAAPPDSAPAPKPMR